jgi:methylenetetrahydrofolate--tRNA-(uracil-5-)-methyltransferase
MDPVAFPCETAIGALHAYITERERKFFQPMNINYGLMPAYLAGVKANKHSKGERRLEVAAQALKTLDTFLPALIPS